MLLRTSLAALLCGAAARAQIIEPALTRPITLPAGVFDLTLHATYANVADGHGSEDGGTVAMGLDLGASDRVQVGLATAFPILPGAGFGSLIASGLVALDRDVAVRGDFGYERIGLTGTSGSGESYDIHIHRFFGGVGARGRFPIGPNVAFVFGRSGAVHFGPFQNLGSGGLGLYTGASFLAPGSSDLVVLSSGDNQSGNLIGVHLPAGLLVQAHPAVAITLETGYAALIALPAHPDLLFNNSSTLVLHYVPLAIEVDVMTPAPFAELGVRLSNYGFTGASGLSGTGPGYFDQRSFMFWLRLHG